VIPVPSFTRLLAALLALVCLPAFAEDERSVDGLGRVSVQAGYRWVPNVYFAQQAGAAGYPMPHHSPGGPQGSLSFGYGATQFIEGTIDLFIGYEQLKLANLDPFDAYSYGALFGARAVAMDWPFHGLAPYVGVQVGPLLGVVDSKTYPNHETVTTGYSFQAGATLRFGDRFGLDLSVRYLVGRSYVTGISGVNVGGLLVSLGLNVYFAGPPNKNPTSDLIPPQE